MTELKLKSMHLENFKAIKDLTIEFSPTVTQISGRNGSGKSSIVDAFCWVLFNADSHGNAPGSDKFREKPLDATGQEVHYLDTVVELYCELNELPLIIKRLQRENWTKKRGFADEIYSGNESTYWINGLEVKKSDYQARIAEIAPADIMKILASLGEINRMSWQDRRAELIGLCNVDVDMELLVKDEFRQIADEVGKTGVPALDQNKLAKDRVKNINAQLKMCPIRIDEATKALPDVDDRKLKDAQYMINDAQSDIDKIDKTIAELRADKNGSTARQQIIELEIERDKLCGQLENELKDKRAAANRAVDSLRASRQRIADYKLDLTNRLKMAQDDVERYTKMRNDLRRDFHAAANDPIPKLTNCPECGQPLSEDLAQLMYEQRSSKREAMKETIRESGKKAAAQVEEAQKRVDEIMADLEKVVEQLDTTNAEYDKAAKALVDLPSKPDFGHNPRIDEITNRIIELQETEAISVADEKIAGLNRRKAELQEIIKRSQAVVAKYEAADETRKRIDDLKDEQVELGKDLADAEKYLALTEQFIRARCNLLTDSINAQFPSVKWKLFNEQINGAISDVCMCMIPCDGALVAYETANTASQINADIEIIKAFSKEYDIKVPLFIDNAERVITLEDADTQTITLSVSADEGLKIQEG